MKPAWKVVPNKWRAAAGGGKQPYQGMFYPGNPTKYEGDINNVVFRSGLELRLFKHLDEHSRVLKWSSEETIIPYVSPIDNRVHRYFVDVKMVALNKQGSESTTLIEVKPHIQCSPPNAPKKPNKKNQARFLKESMTYEVNDAKWTAARAHCKKHGWLFQIITENDLQPGR